MSIGRAAEVKAALAARAENFTRWLFPNGKREGSELKVGSVDGEPGKSLSICIAGTKAGKFKDFADGQSGGNNLIELYAQAKRVDFKTAFYACEDWLVGRNGSRPIGKKRSEKKVGIDWQACVDAFTKEYREWLAEWRGYSEAFILWLHASGLVGIAQGCVAFPVHNTERNVVAAHLRKKDGSWRYLPSGTNTRPLIIGDLTDGKPVHVFESQWDGFAFMDISGERSGIIITRGASNGALVAGLISPRSPCYCWTQNDASAEKWEQAVCANTKGTAKRVKIPALRKDLNQWVQAGAQSDDLVAAIAQADLDLNPLNLLIPPQTIGNRPVEINETIVDPFIIQSDGFPRPMDAAFYGLAGDVVRRIEPHTEADPVALLFQLLTAFGSIIGRCAYMVADGSRHFLNLFGVLVGESSKSRKGTSWNRIADISERVDEEWRKNCTANGLSSGEGVIWAVHDPISKTVKNKKSGQYETEIVDAGIADKRLCVIEGEFANVLKVMTREGNTLSPIIRAGWETGELRAMTKNSPARATGAHISIIGHITRAELRRLLTETESGNGFGNRFLWIAVKRSKCLPEGGQIETVNFSDLIIRLQRAIEFARKAGELERSEAARELWRADYPELSDGKLGMLGAVTARAEAQVMRLSAIYALLDYSALIQPVHHQAAMALWAYCERSAQWIFSTLTGDPRAERILAALQEAGDSGLTRTEINERVFNGHIQSDSLKGALRLLRDSGLAKFVREETPGAPRERWFCTVTDRADYGD